MGLKTVKYRNISQDFLTVCYLLYLNDIIKTNKKSVLPTRQKQKRKRAYVCFWNNYIMYTFFRKLFSQLKEKDLTTLYNL